MMLKLLPGGEIGYARISPPLPSCYTEGVHNSKENTTSVDATQDIEIWLRH